jgi:hypothetical protein
MMPLGAEASATSLQGSMEGRLEFGPGSYLSGGYRFRPVDRSRNPYQVTFSSVRLELPVSCSRNGAVAGTVVLNLPDATYTVPARSEHWIPARDDDDMLPWQGAVAVPAICGAGKTMYNRSGATFAADVTSSVAGRDVEIQFHYALPAGHGKPNTNCTNAADPNRLRPNICGASWSDGKRVTPSADAGGGGGGLE